MDTYLHNCKIAELEGKKNVLEMKMKFRQSFIVDVEIIFWMNF